MIQESRIFGLGLAYVDGKISSPDLNLPSEKDELPTFLDHHPEAKLYPGGSIPNILTSFVKLSHYPRVKLLSCVGDDQKGKFYTDYLDKRLDQPQVSLRNRTGLWVGIYDRERIVEHMDYSGASVDITVADKDLQAAPGQAIVTDIDTYNLQPCSAQVERAVEAIGRNGKFILSLGGANRSDFERLLLPALKPPDIVFGTSSELSHITNQKVTDVALSSAFPQSRLVVITEGEKGAFINFEGKTFHAGAYPVPRERVVDATGAGDAYMGTMLAMLFQTPYHDWSENDIKNAALAAAYASSLVIQTESSRLSTEMAELVLNYR